jgi:hypothetical protein
MSQFQVWGLMCALVSAGFAMTAVRIYLRRRRFLARAMPALGKVVDVKIRGTGRNAMSFPVFAFRTEGGEDQRAESQMGSGFQAFRIGETVAVRYDPTNPAIADVDTFAVMWGLVLLRAGFALLFMIMAGIGLVLG